MRAVVRYPSSVALAVLIGAMLFLGSAPTRAQSKSQVAPVDQVAEFYRGRTITLSIGYASGGGYDLYGRLIAKHFPRFLPGSPNVVVQNVPGGGSLLLANHLFNALPKDGSHIGIISNSLPLEEAFGLPQAKFAANSFNWIGRLDDLTLILIAWHTSKVSSVADALKSNFSIGVPGKGSTADSALSVIKQILNTQYQLITGYRSGLETKMAMERGEVDATASVQWSTLREINKDWIDTGKVRILVQLGLEKQPGLENVPLIGDFAPDQRSLDLINLLMAPAAIGRAIVAPPGIPPARVAALRNVFDRMISDPEFLEDDRKQHLSINARSGASLQKVVESIAGVPKIRLIEAKALFEAASR